ncbi:MAG: class I SAM-dependent methyltransferase [Thermodesulfobacteriota bacterium]
MGHVFDFNAAKAYEQWLKSPSNRMFVDFEKKLLLDLLKPIPGKTVLDIGCGTGASLKPLIDAGLRTTGIDPSPYMLDLASKNLGKRAELHRGIAEDLPFDDNSFNYASLITTLEFVENPKRALEEACRVAKDKIYIGVLNRYAIKGIQLRIRGLFTKTLFNHAQFFSVWELKQTIHSLAGNVPLTWRTICHLPAASGKFSQKFERFSLVQRCPFGMYTGMAVTLVPRFTTQPLTLRYGAKRTTGEVTSSLCANRENSNGSMPV